MNDLGDHSDNRTGGGEAPSHLETAVPQKRLHAGHFWKAAGGVLLLACLYLISRSDYLLFHTLAEMFSIVVAWSLFILVWNSRRFIDNPALVFVGIAYLFIGFVDLLHTLSYKGMGIVAEEMGANPATQLWIAGRYMESLSLFAFPFLFFRRMNFSRVLGIYAAATAFVLLSIFSWDLFPDCFIEGRGLTPFKKVSEYLIVGILGAAAAFLHRKRTHLDPKVFRLLLASIFLTIAGELAFTFYISVYGLSNLLGHYLKIFSFFCIYAALIRSSLQLPYSVLFRELEQRKSDLEEMTDLLESTGRMAKVGGWELDPFTRKVTWTAQTYRIHEVPYGAKPSLEEAIDFFHPEDRQKLSRALERAMAHGEPYDMELRFITAKGNHLWTHTRCRPETKNGKVIKLKGTFQDITEQKRTEAEKEELEEKYQQAQRLESIGRLAGGMAHDLNNMLSPILGYGEMLLEESSPGDPDLEALEEIVYAGSRARDLVHRLLAFSRRQALAFEPVDLNALLGRFANLLRRTIRENVEIRLDPAPSLPTVTGDAGQIEQVVLNLAVNAQEAMPEGGRLTIETAAVDLDAEDAARHEGLSPGRYVLLTVTDTGSGMDGHTKAQIFEPFFTTKDKTGGTGLGLATVYGIVRQHKGAIWAYSEPGFGATFKVYLPVSEKPAAESRPSDRWSDQAGGTETILLAEDNEQVRNLARAVLERKGYTVLAAESGEQALSKLAEWDGPVDLLLSDVIMPDMNGRRLSEQVSDLRPGISTLYMSGYTDDVISHHGVLDEGVHLVSKPFSGADLLKKVRELLDKRGDSRNGAPGAGQ